MDRNIFNKATLLDWEIKRVGENMRDLNKFIEDININTYTNLHVEISAEDSNVLRLDYTSNFIKDVFIPQYKEYLHNEEIRIRAELEKL